MEEGEAQQRPDILAMATVVDMRLRRRDPQLVDRRIHSRSLQHLQGVGAVPGTVPSPVSAKSLQAFQEWLLIWQFDLQSDLVGQGLLLCAVLLLLIQPHVEAQRTTTARIVTKTSTTWTLLKGAQCSQT